MREVGEACFVTTTRAVIDGAFVEGVLEARSKERVILTWDILNNLAIMATNSRRHLAVRPAILLSLRCIVWYVVNKAAMQLLCLCLVTSLCI